MPKGRRSYSFGPFAVQASPKRKPNVNPPPPRYEGWPDLATWGVAAALEPELRKMATAALYLAENDCGAKEEPRRTEVARTLLARMLRERCEEHVVTLTELSAHLVEVGLDAVSWDAIAERALR